MIRDVESLFEGRELLFLLGSIVVFLTIFALWHKFIPLLQPLIHRAVTTAAVKGKRESLKSRQVVHTRTMLRRHYAIPPEDTDVINKLAQMSLALKLQQIEIITNAWSKAKVRECKSSEESRRRVNMFYKQLLDDLTEQ